MAKTMIRPATLDDIPRMLELGAIMHAESPRFNPFQFLPDRLENSIRSVMAMGNGLVIVADKALDGIVGGLLAVAVPHYACDFLQASDLAFFVHPDYRGGSAALRLVDAYREWAHGIGAEPSIGINTGVQPERTGRLFGALGAVQSGTIWTWGAHSCASVRG